MLPFLALFTSVLKMEATYMSETLVSTYKALWCYNPKDAIIKCKWCKGGNYHSRLRWPRDLRRGSAAPRLPWLRVRISSVSCECCVWSGRGTDHSYRGVLPIVVYSECNRGTSTMWWSRPTEVCRAIIIKKDMSFCENDTVRVLKISQRLNSVRSSHTDSLMRWSK